MRVIYLHGFASGPQSRKARAFQSALAALGQVNVDIPTLTDDFEHLTISGQLNVIEHTLKGGPARLIGSSMGGYLAALYAARHPEVERLILLAPAFHFPARWSQVAGPAQMQAWQDTGWQEIFHYGDQAMRRVHYDLYQDALQYEPYPDFAQPARIFHGIHDDTVPIEYSRAFAASHPNVALTELDSDHELLNVLDVITSQAAPFLLEGPATG